MPTHLPLEILGKVFELVVPDVLDNETHKSLLSLCLVCKAWRDAAYLHHQLWSKISVDDTSNEGFSYEKILRWLGRSAGLPRSLEYTTTCMASAEECAYGFCESPNPVLAKVLRHSERIDHLEVWCVGVQCVRALRAWIDNTNLNLSPAHPSGSRRFEELPIASMTLHLGQNFDRTVQLPLPHTISSLQLDILGNIDDDSGFGLFSTGWIVAPSARRTAPSRRENISPTTLQNLTSLTLNSSWDLADLAETLGGCTNLLDLTLGLRNRSYFPTTRTIQEEGIVLPNVASLALTGLVDTSLPVLDVLRPRVGTLRKVHVSFGSPQPPEMRHVGHGMVSAIRASWMPFVRRHAEALETLSIQDASLSGDPVLEALVSTELYAPNVRRFSFDGIVPSPGLFSGESGPSFLNVSHVESLSFVNMDKTFALDEVLGFLKRRRPYRVVDDKPVFEGPPDTIKRVTVTYRGPSSYSSNYDTAVEWTVEPHCKETLDVARALTKGGLDVEIGPIYRQSTTR